MRRLLVFVLMIALAVIPAYAQKGDKKRPREYGVKIGVMTPGANNAITDVSGVLVGHVTLNEGKATRTGVTAVVPYKGNIFRNKVPAAFFVGNGFGKMAGGTQIDELGNIESPIILTNTLNIAAGLDGIIDFTYSFPENKNDVWSVNGIVGETNDAGLNDIKARKVTKKHVVDAINKAKSGPVEEGNVGAGTGTTAFGFKAGIGTASRVLPADLGGYTVGVLVQANFGGVLEINGAPVGVELGQYSFKKNIESADGSIMIIVATDAPLDARNLKRLAKRAFVGIGKTGGIVSNGSGDYVIAFSTDPSIRVPYSTEAKLDSGSYLRNDEMSPLFLAVIEATEEAIINSLFAAKTMTGHEETVYELPVDKTLEILKKYNKIQ